MCVFAVSCYFELNLNPNKNMITTTIDKPNFINEYPGLFPGPNHLNIHKNRFMARAPQSCTHIKTETDFKSRNILSTNQTGAFHQHHSQLHSLFHGQIIEETALPNANPSQPTSTDRKQQHDGPYDSANV